MWRGLVLLSILVVAACTNGAREVSRSGEPNESDTPPPAASIDLETVDLVELITWDQLDFFGMEQVKTGPTARILEAIAASGDDRFIAVLLDLAFQPTPYQELAYELLPEVFGPHQGRWVVDWIDQRGFKEPADDLPSYLEFKQHLLATIVPGFADFLDPSQPRTISAQEVVWGGVNIDGIPPLEHPEFIAPEEATWINDDDLVIGVEIGGDARAYPRRIIDWHEMVNDTVGGIPVSLAYCTLCGSAILYDGRVGDEVYEFGTSGLLYRSNKLMYDRTTRTLWEQYTGEPVWGSLVGSGIRLDILPVVVTTWQAWYADHPDTTVLSIDTGFVRNYGPGVAYRDYFASDELIFPAPSGEGPLELKASVYAVRVDDELTAYPIALLQERGLLHDTIGSLEVVVLATTDGNGGRAYESGGWTFSVVDLEAGTLQSEDGTRWQVTESSLIADDGRTMARLPGHNSFWFAVTNHTSDSRLYTE